MSELKYNINQVLTFEDFEKAIYEISIDKSISIYSDWWDNAYRLTSRENRAKMDELINEEIKNVKSYT